MESAIGDRKVSLALNQEKWICGGCHDESP
jgi:hypothetical protein